MKEEIVWMLPTKQSDVTNNDYIVRNAKLHCYNECVSLCKKHFQSHFFEHYDIDAFLEEHGEEYVCSKCLKEYKKIMENNDKPRNIRKR